MAGHVKTASHLHLQVKPWGKINVWLGCRDWTVRDGSIFSHTVALPHCRQEGNFSVLARTIHNVNACSDSNLTTRRFIETTVKSKSPKHEDIYVEPVVDILQCKCKPSSRSPPRRTEPANATLRAFTHKILMLRLQLREDPNGQDHHP